MQTKKYHFTTCKKAEEGDIIYVQQDLEIGLKNILGAAFIASNPVSTLLANIFTKTSNIDSKFLRNEKDALSWIVELKRKNSRM
jgi:hypothetical protein